MEHTNTTNPPSGGEQQPVLMTLDPRDLLENPANPRDSLGDLKGLTASVKEVGVLQALTVTPAGDGKYRTILGHRRRQAALDASLTQVPCWVREDLADKDPDQLAHAIVENDQRHDINEIERTRGFAQLEAWGWTEAKIARRTSTRRADVARSLQVAGSDHAFGAMGDHGLTLEQAAVIAEFGGDPAAVESLVQAAEDGIWRFEHEASRLRRDRDYQAARQELVGEHTAAGIVVIDGDALAEDTDALDTPRLVRELADQDGERLDPESHHSCPGHAVHIPETGWAKPKATAVCQDPQGNGHGNRWTRASGPAKPDGPTRAEVIAQNKAWRAATDTRHRYIKELLARRTPPERTLQYVTEEILARPERVGDGKDDTLAELTGTTPPSGYGRRVGPVLVAKSTRKRLPLVLLAQLAADHETTMGVQTWRRTDPVAARWFEFLASTGYTLSAIEQLVVDTARQATEQSSAPGPTEQADQAHSADVVALPSRATDDQTDDEDETAEPVCDTPHDAA